MCAPTILVCNIYPGPPRGFRGRRVNTKSGAHNINGVMGGGGSGGNGPGKFETLHAHPD